MTSAYFRNINPKSDNILCHIDSIKRKRRLLANDINNSKRRRCDEVIKDEMFDDIDNMINYVPFPQQPKSNGVVIEEISENDIDQNIEIVSSQTQVESFPDQIILAPELLKFIKSDPLAFLRKLNSNYNDRDTALVLYKPIHKIDQEKSENVESDLKNDNPDYFQYISNSSDIELMEVEDMDTE